MPGAWGGWSNGKIPTSAMVQVRGEWFKPDAAAGLVAMENAFSAHFGSQFIITEGYRSYATQEYYYNNPASHGYSIAAVPGTSNHGWGEAADLGSGINSFGTAQHNWAVANGPKFGWRWGSTPSEPWHFDFYPGTATASLDATRIEDELTPEQDALLRNIAGFLYAGGTDASNPNYYGMPGSLYHLVKSPVFREINGKTQKIPQIQDNADTNTMVRSLLVQVGALSKVVQSLAAANGADPDTITKLVEKAAHDGAQDAFADLHLGGTVEIKSVNDSN